MSNRLKLLRDRAVRSRRTVPIVLDGEVREQVEAVELALDRLDLPRNDRRLNTKQKTGEREKLLEELDKLYQQADDATLYLVLEAMQRTPYRALVAAHPPRKDKDGKVVEADRMAGGVNVETWTIAVIRACIIGYRERPDSDAPVLPLDETVRDQNGKVVEVGMLDFLLGYADGESEVEGFASPGQISTLSRVAVELCTGDDAVPLQRRRSVTETSDAE